MAGIAQMLDRAFEALAKTLLANLFKVAIDRESGRHIELRKSILNLVELYMTSLRELHGSRYDLRRMRKNAQHFFCGLHIKLIAIKSKALFIVNRAARLYA